MKDLYEKFAYDYDEFGPIEEIIKECFRWLDSQISGCMGAIR